MINIFLVPERLEDAIGEAESQEVLYRLFAHIVVDAVGLILAEDSRNFTIELLSRCQVTPKGLFDDEACPGLFITILSSSGACQASTTKLENDF